MIDEALNGDGRTHPLGEHDHHFYGALPAARVSGDAIADANRGGGLGGAPIHLDMAAAARFASLRTRLVQPDRP